MLPKSLVLLAIVAGGFAVETTLGFGATVIAVSLGAFWFPLSTLVPALVPVNLGLSLYIVLRYGGAIDRRLLLGRVVPFMLAGLPLGLLAFRYAGEHWLKLVFGVLVVVLAVSQLLRMSRGGVVAALPPVASGLLLFLAGVAHGAFSTGGPLAVYVAGRQLPDPAGFRSTLSALWLILGGVLVVGYLWTGAIGERSLSLSLVCAAGLAIGILVGELLHRRLDRRVFTVLVHSLLLVAGALLAVRA